MLGCQSTILLHWERKELPNCNRTQNPLTFAWDAKLQTSSFPTHRAHRAISCVLTLAGAAWRIFFFRDVVGHVRSVIVGRRTSNNRHRVWRIDKYQLIGRVTGRSIWWIVDDQLNKWQAPGPIILDSVEPQQNLNRLDIAFSGVGLLVICTDEFV